MNILSSARTMPLCLGLGLVTLPVLETAARAQAATDFTTNLDGAGGLIITGYTGSVTAVVIPGTINGLTVTGIGTNASQNKSSLTSVTLVQGLTSLSRDAFEGCSGLTSLSLSSHLTAIGTFAFSHCSGLTSFTISCGVTDIQQRCFEKCTNLTSLTITPA